MKEKLRWYDHLTINSYWFGINIASGILTPLLLPYLVVMFMPPEQKNTYYAFLRVTGLAMAMLVQPIAGMLSDRSTLKWGKRRPYIFMGAVLNVLFLVLIGASPMFMNAASDEFFQAAFGITTAFAVLLLGNFLLQISANIAHGSLQGVIPDLVPEDQRGRASGVKAVLELLPVFLALFIGPLVDKGMVWLVVSIIMAGFLVTMLVTIFLVKEEPLKEKPEGKMTEPVLRIVALTAIFVLVSQVAVWIVRAGGNWMTAQESALAMKITVLGLIGVAGMAGAIFIGVFLGAWIGIGKDASGQKSFIWWVVNRLLFLAAVGSIQGFAQYYLADVIKVAKPATMTSVLLGAVAVFLLPSALIGGNLADRVGRKRLVFYSGLIAAGGTFLLLTARGMPMVVISGCIIGTGAGTFMATNWALGTDLAPSSDAGRYLGISNLAGAGAGIVGAGIGGPIADFFNAISSGLGYIVVFALYGLLFLFSSAVLRLVHSPQDAV